VDLREPRVLPLRVLLERLVRCLQDEPPRAVQLKHGRARRLPDDVVCVRCAFAVCRVGDVGEALGREGRARPRVGSPSVIARRRPRVDAERAVGRAGRALPEPLAHGGAGRGAHGAQLRGGAGACAGAR
jgi:hypothetical protein